MDTFKDLSPEEIKMITLQFMGQHLTGDLKQLESHMISKTTSLQGMTIDPAKVINSIPAQATTVAAPAPEVVSSINAQVKHQNQPAAPAQIRFSDVASSNSDKLFLKLDEINTKLSQIIDLLKK